MQEPSVSVEHLNCITESVQSSLERIFGRGGGRIPVTPSESFEKRMGVFLLPLHMSFSILKCFI